MIRLAWYDRRLACRRLRQAERLACLGEDS